MNSTWFSLKRGLVPALFLLSSTLYGHVAQGAGEALQLYSYRLTGTPPVIDGSAFSRNGDPSTKDALDEWKEAYVRTIKLSDGTDASLLLCNSDDTLYIAVNYDHGNNSDGSGVRLYFDEGDNASEVGDGNHDHLLTANGGERNEAGYALFKGGAGAAELSWDGADWLADGDGGVFQDFNGARYYFNDAVKVHTHEFAIPLNTTTEDDADNSDIQIEINDELGFYLQVIKNGSGAGTYHWDKTNGELTDPSGWADIRLNVSNRFFAFYGTYAANGAPTVDGELDDDAWRGSYRRDIVLTNFQGETVDATLYATQDHATDIVYFGLEVKDTLENAGDYLQLYFEDAPGAGSTDRDYYLDNTNSIEDALIIQGNSHTDQYWNSGTPAFENDPEGADNHAGIGTYDNKMHLFEGAIPYAAGANDIDVDAGGIAGMIIRYFDADADAGEESFYWDFGANVAGLKIDPNSNDYLAIGWPALQLGAPYVQVIFPEDQKSVEGVVNIRVAAIDENADGIDSAYFYRIQDTATIIELTKVADTDEFSGTLDVTALANGPDTLVISVVDDDGIKIDRLVVLNVNNDGGSYKAPEVSLASPVGGTELSGTATFTLNVTTGANSLTEFYLLIDGDSITLANTAGSYQLATGDYSDGVHTIQFLAKNDQDLMALSQVYSFTFVNAPTVAMSSPTADAVLTGLDTIAFTASPIAPATLAKREIWVDGSYLADATTDSTYVWNTAAFNDGQHSVQVKVTDSDGRVSMSELRLVTLINRPAVIITSPDAGEAVNGTVTVRFVASAGSQLSTIVKRELSLDGAMWDTTGVGDSTYSLNTSTLENGSHDIVIQITDDKGRTITSLSRTFVVDNEAPLTADPQVVYPGTEKVVNNSSPILITALVKDNIVGLATTNAVVLTSDAINTAGATTLEMKDDGTGGDLVAGDNVFTASVTVATDSSGVIDFTVTSIDALGNTASVTSSVMLDNTVPVISAFDYHPDLESATATSGVVYHDRIIVRGGYTDDGSGIHRAVIEVINEDGDYVNNSPLELAVEDSLFSRIVEFVPGVNVVTFKVMDKAGNSVSSIDTITYIEPKATEVIDNDGGTVSSQNGVSVEIPANALLGSEEITITRVNTDELPEPESDDVVLLGVPHDFGPDGMSFRKPVTITLTYTEADLDKDLDGEPDLDPAKFGAVFWDGDKWHYAGASMVDTVNRTVTVKVNHFTVFDIAELSVDAPTELVTYWTENPFSAEQGSLFNYRIPTAGTVSMSVLDLSGELVYQLIQKDTDVEPGFYSVAWYGQNVAERRLAPGIYVTLFTYTPDGGSTEIIRKPIGLLK